MRNSLALSVGIAALWTALGARALAQDDASGGDTSTGRPVESGAPRSSGAPLESGAAQAADDDSEAAPSGGPILPPDPSVFADAGGDGGARSGSMWDQGEARVMLGMNGNAREIGDLVTVDIALDSSTEIQADTSTSRSSEMSAGIGSLFGLGVGASKSNANLNGGVTLDVNSGADFSGDGVTRRSEKFAASVTCEVVEVLPNKNLRIMGVREVSVNRETQTLTLTGVLRPRDIKADNTVDSRVLAQLRVEYAGSGVVADKQGPGVGQRVIDHVWPF